MAETKHNFQKLTPFKDAKIDIYSEALDFVFDNKELRNIALSGAYGAGKSSVLETYKNTKPDKKFLHISLAHFEPTKQNEEKEIEPIVKEPILEGKILNQLIQQIAPEHIPQTNFRVKQKVSKKPIFFYTILIIFFVLSLLHIIFFASWNSFISSISTNFIKTLFILSTKNTSAIFSGLICTIIVGIFLFHIIKLQINKSLFKKISTDNLEIEIFEETNDSCFDKYLNEVLYLFDQSGADVIVFEDMDRYNANQIFIRLREINTIIHALRSKQKDYKPLRFFYLLRDDIFLSKDRAKFFDFIIPIIPIVDGSNSYGQFVELLKKENIYKEFEESFLQGLSLYIDDMRILKNIYNEFIIYFNRLNITELNPNKMMAMITYKNLFPRDFSELQLGHGFVHTLFASKEKFITDKIKSLSDKLTTTENELKKELNDVKNEHLKSIQELDIIFENKRNEINNNYYRNSQEIQRQLQLINTEYSKRKDVIENNNSSVLKLEKMISNIKNDILKVKNETLQKIITRENIENIFATTNKNEIGEKFEYKEIKGNSYFALLKFLIRNGFIDESYADYMTYFDEHSLNKIDKMFLRSITDQIGKEHSYKLIDPPKIISRLNVTNFTQPEILNFNLLSYLLETPKYQEYLDTFITQLKDSENYSFVQEFFQWKNDDKLYLFVNKLNVLWKNFLSGVLEGKELTETHINKYLLLTLYHTPDSDLTSDTEFNKFLTDFISEKTDSLKIDSPDIDKLISRFQLLNISFVHLDYKNSDKALFEAVYAKSLYQLNFVNISQILIHIYNLPETHDFKHKNYTLVMSKNESPLIEKINKDIKSYILEIINNCDGSISDDENIVLSILNNTKISNENKNAYIAVLKTIIHDITNIKTKELWAILIKQNILEHSEKNIIEYYLASDEELQTDLIEFINSKDSKYDYTTTKQKYTDEIQSSFFNSIIRCNELDNNHYKSIISTLSRVYTKGFSIKEINDEKIHILIDTGTIPMLKESLIFIRGNYPNTTLHYIKKNIKTYVEEILNNVTFDFDEILGLLEQDISDDYKIKLLANTNAKISIKQNYTDSIKAHIIKNNFDENDLSNLLTQYPNEGKLTREIIEKTVIAKLDKVFNDKLNISISLLDKLLLSDISNDIKIKLLAISLPILDELKCRNYLKQLKLDDFESLFDRKRPKFECNNVNERILDIFQQKGWITKFEKDESGNYYRAYGRKSDDKEDAQ